MLFKQMKYFKSVVDKMNFYEAAEDCGVSQSAISQQIKALEEELGVLLLKRHNRTFSLTEAGKLFYRKSIIILSDIEILKTDVLKLQRYNRTSLKIGYLMNYDGYELHNAVATYRLSNPTAEIDLIPGTHEELYELLRTGKIDIAFNDQRRAFSEDYNNIELSSLHYAVEISSFHPYASLSEVEVSDLKNFPCIVIATPQSENSEFTYYHEILGFSGDFVFARNISEARVFVTSGRGIFPIVSSSKENNFPASIKRLPLLRSGHTLNCRLCAFTKKEFNLDPYTKLLFELKNNFANQF